MDDIKNKIKYCIFTFDWRGKFPAVLLVEACKRYPTFTLFEIDTKSDFYMYVLEESKESVYNLLFEYEKTINDELKTIEDFDRYTLKDIKKATDRY